MLLKRVYICCLLAFLGASTSCKKDGFTPLTDTKPSIPVTVTNSIGTFNSPVVSASNADGKITIVLSIPDGTGRAIKEITKVAASTSYKSVEQASNLYNTAPIPGNGTSVTFTTTLAEYKTKTGVTPPLPNLANSFLTQYFYFLVTLDNGQTIIPTYVKVLVVS